MPKRIFALLMALLIAGGVSGCFGKDDEPDDNSGQSEIMPEDELVIYHNSSNLSPALAALAESYSAGGKKISAKMGGNDFLGEIKSQNPAIYVVDTHDGLSEWHSGGFFTDLLNDAGLSSFGGKVPAGLQLNQNGIGSYGFPLMLEGYGYIVDKNMLTELFGDSAEALLSDLKTCSYNDFAGFVTAVDTYISAPSESEVTVGGNKYRFNAEKSEAASDLTGVFSLNSESTRAMEHLLSYVLAAKFGSRYEVMNVTPEALDDISGLFDAFSEVMDLHTSHIAGAEGSIGRGEEFTGGDYNYSTSIDLFTRGNALFYPGGTADRSDFEESSAGFGENLDIIPMKLPLSDEEITASGMSAEKLQSSIVIGSRYYLAVNPNSDEKTAAAAREFISWLYSDEAGKTAFNSAFGANSFNFGGEMTEENPMGNSEITSSEGEMSGSMESSEEVTRKIPLRKAAVSDSLMNSVMEYYNSGNWIADMAASLPVDFADNVLGSLSDYWGMEAWSSDDRKNFTDSIINGWKELIDSSNSAVG